MALGQLIAVNGSQFVLQFGRGGEAIGNCVGVGQGIDFDRLDQCDADVADARDVAPLASPHVAEFPQANRLRFFAGADRGQKFLFEEEHDDGQLVAEGTSRLAESGCRSAKKPWNLLSILAHVCPCKRGS